MICAPLQGFLSICGIETDVVEVDFPTTNHCWLARPDGTIIDPTASQFSTREQPLPKVYIGPVPTQYQAWIAEAASEVDAEMRLDAFDSVNRLTDGARDCA